MSQTNSSNGNIFILFLLLAINAVGVLFYNTNFNQIKNLEKQFEEPFFTSQFEER